MSPVELVQKLRAAEAHITTLTEQRDSAIAEQARLEARIWLLTKGIHQ